MEDQQFPILQISPLHGTGFVQGNGKVHSISVATGVAKMTEQPMLTVLATLTPGFVSRHQCKLLHYVVRSFPFLTKAWEPVLYSKKNKK